MRSLMVMLAALFALIAGARAFGDDECPREARLPHCLQAFRPAGGCNPYGGGLFHWWDPQCFERPCGPDDYCRKPFPNVCRQRCFVRTCESPMLNIGN
jgi:hypothetical protein